MIILAPFIQRWEWKISFSPKKSLWMETSTSQLEMWRKQHGKNILKKLEILVFNLIYESERAFITLTTLAYTKFLEIRKFSEILISVYFFFQLKNMESWKINKKPQQSPQSSRRNEIGSFLPQDFWLEAPSKCSLKFKTF